jgi:Asp/Glu/hydantoin racemase
MAGAVIGRVAARSRPRCLGARLGRQREDRGIVKQRLALIHTVSSLVPVFEGLAKELLADTDRFNIVDESLLKDTIRDGSLTPERMRRVLGHVAAAEDAGADLVLVTCSSIGPAVDASQPFARKPLLRVDEPMADRAVAIGARIGVLATLSTTLDPTAELIQRRAAAADRTIELIRLVCDGAFEAISRGDVERHDALVRECLQSLFERQPDVVVLAQASMARVADQVPEAQRAAPILSSPRLAIERVRTLVDAASA